MAVCKINLRLANSSVSLERSKVLCPFKTTSFTGGFDSHIALFVSHFSDITIIQLSLEFINSSKVLMYAYAESTFKSLIYSFE